MMIIDHVFSLFVAYIYYVITGVNIHFQMNGSEPPRAILFHMDPTLWKIGRVLPPCMCIWVAGHEYLCTASLKLSFFLLYLENIFAQTALKWTYMSFLVKCLFLQVALTSWCEILKAKQIKQMLLWTCWNWSTKAILDTLDWSRWIETNRKDYIFCMKRIQIILLHKKQQTKSFCMTSKKSSVTPSDGENTDIHPCAIE